MKTDQKPYELINGKRIYYFSTKDQFLNYIKNKKQILIALNAEKLNKQSTELDVIINNNIGYPDGIGAVLALKRKGINSIKIAGAEFWLDIILRFESEKSFYLVGASQEVIDQTINRLHNEFPNIRIVGYRNGYLQKGDEKTLIADILEKKPDVVFMAMGSPKQEIIMSSFIKDHPALYMGLGGSFDVYAGKVERAPEFFQKLGLEWFYRLLKEPTRWRRQLNLGQFFIKLIFNKI